MGGCVARQQLLPHFLYPGKQTNPQVPLEQVEVELTGSRQTLLPIPQLDRSVLVSAQTPLQQPKPDAQQLLPHTYCPGAQHALEGHGIVKS